MEEKGITEILDSYKTIAIVGLSGNPERPSYEVASYLQQQGYRIIPVNPAVEEVLGEHSYPNLKDIPHPVEVVDIFRRPDDIPPIVEEAIQVGAKVIWMQLGIIHEAAAQRACEAGLKVVMNRCMKMEHQARHAPE